MLLQPARIPRAPRGGIAQYKGGQFIPYSLLESEKNIAKDAFVALQSEFGNDLQFLRAVGQLLSNLKGVDVEIPAPLSERTVTDRAVRHIRSYYSRAFLLGKRASGNLLSIGSDERNMLRKIRTDEYKYLRRFFTDISNKLGKIPYEKRMAYYQHALREAFWLGFCIGDTTATRTLWWHFGNTIEHCTDCALFANRPGGWPIAEFIDQVIKPGKLPQSGSLECKGLHCECYLTDTPEKDKRYARV